MAEATVKETACPDCGEMVRVNSLRCWNCGGFMDAELEQRYLAMQNTSRPVIFSDAAEGATGDDDSDDEGEGFQLKTPLARPVESPKSIPVEDNDIIRIVADPVVVEESDSSVDQSDAGKSPEAEKSSSEAVPSASSSEKAKKLREAPEDGVAHSIATGGDALLEIAKLEEREARKRQKGRRVQGGMRTAGGGLVIFCPYGCKIEVKESHRGMTGKCPRCQAPFIVPVDPPIFKQSKAEATTGTGEKSADVPKSDDFRRWLTDLRLHVVDPEKLKLKADSLAKEFTEVDLGFSNDLFLVASLSKGKKGGGLFSKGGGKKEDVRAELIAHLNEKKSLDELPVGESYQFSSEELLQQLKVVQPAADRATNIFHGIPVFGTNRVAIQLPLNDKLTHPVYLSFGITEFWKFREAIEEFYQISDLDADLGLPREPRFDSLKCHYNDTPIKSLLDVELYQADPAVKLEVAGYQCGSCRITVSEAGRKKENLGGKSPKGIAKAKCPKCGSKMGEHLLYSLQEDVVDPTMA